MAPSAQAEFHQMAAVTLCDESLSAHSLLLCPSRDPWFLTHFTYMCQSTVAFVDAASSPWTKTAEYGGRRVGYLCITS